MKPAWVPPGSPINGTFFHAQVLVSVHGFSPGVIDGKEGESIKVALTSFHGAGAGADRQARHPDTRALLKAERPSKDGRGMSGPVLRRSARGRALY